MTSRRVRQQTAQNTRRKRPREKQSSNRSVSSGVKLTAHVRNQSIEIPRPPPRKPSSRRLWTNDPTRPSSPVTTQLFKDLAFYPLSDIEIPIPDTSPRRIRSLWQLVMPPKRDTPTRGTPARVLPQRSGAVGKNASQTT